MSLVLEPCTPIPFFGPHTRAPSPSPPPFIVDSFEAPPSSPCRLPFYAFINYARIRLLFGDTYPLPPIDSPQNQLNDDWDDLPELIDPDEPNRSEAEPLTSSEQFLEWSPLSQEHDQVPLPGLDINGIAFDSQQQHQRLLSHWGCREECPVYRALPEVFRWDWQVEQLKHQPVPAKSSFRMLGSIRATKADMSWLLEHDHPVDPDLVFLYPRVSTIPFPLATPIYVATPRHRPARYLWVADINLCWSEIRLALKYPGLMPTRYSLEAHLHSPHPLSDPEYFRGVVNKFRHIAEDVPPAVPIRHAQTGYQVVPRSNFNDILRRVLAYDIVRTSMDSAERPAVFIDNVLLPWSLIRDGVGGFRDPFQDHYRMSWFDVNSALHHVRFFAMSVWIDGLESMTERAQRDAIAAAGVSRGNILSLEARIGRSLLAPGSPLLALFP
ncbi:hypothetical protein C8Q78DRAFT_1081037 [Trametes maxima]|nr:hypothetical protein C8Q78DRAFT_1081037 [Trametes maxima]